LRTFLTIMFFIPFISFGQTDYQKNDHVILHSQKTAGQYIIDYEFKDHFRQMVTVDLRFDRALTDEMIGTFGVPKSMFEPFYPVDEVIRERERVISNGLFRRDDNQIVVDKSAVVSYYAGYFCKPIADIVITELGKREVDSRENRIEMAMKFVQDIPYGVPEWKEDQYFFGGVNVPPEILIHGFGDCDSKSIFFAGILCYLVKPEDIVFLGQEGHVLTAVQSDILDGRTYYTLGDKSYVVAETAGPGRPPFGDKGSNTQGSSFIEPLVFTGDRIENPPQHPDAKSPVLNFSTGGVQDYHMLIVRNECREEIYVVVKYKSLDGPWETEGWFQFKPDEEAYIANTRNTRFYYYAYSEDHIWQGDHRQKFDGKQYGFKEKRIPGSDFGEFYITLKCE